MLDPKKWYINRFSDKLLSGEGWIKEYEAHKEGDETFEEWITDALEEVATIEIIRY